MRVVPTSQTSNMYNITIGSIKYYDNIIKYYSKTNNYFQVLFKESQLFSKVIAGQAAFTMTPANVRCPDTHVWCIENTACMHFNGSGSH